MLATLENMKSAYRPGVIACSFITGEEYSANPADYIFAEEDFVVTDETGAPMYLATRSEVFTIV